MTAVANPDSLIGRSLGDYGLVRELGRGSSGVVFLAEHLATGLNVAIKLAPRHALLDAGVARRMSLEAHFANQIALESVVNVFDFNDEDPAGPYLVMEYLQGETFLDLAAQRVPGDEALSLLVQVAEALGEAHDRSIVHAALKPSNIFRTLGDKNQSLAKLLPFGVAIGPRVAGEEPGDRVVTHLGAPELRAPEQTLGAPADPRMDVYSLGAIAYLLATGRPPFSAPSAQALERAHAEVVPAAPHRVDPRVSRGWSAVIMRALEKSPERRYRSGKEFAEALRVAPAEPEPVGTSARSLDAAGAALSAPPTPAPVVGGLAEGFTVTAAPPADREPAETDAFVVTMPAPLSQRSARPTLYPGVSTPKPSTPSGIVTSTPAPQPPQASAPVAAGLSDSFVVTSTPVPQKAPLDSARGERAADGLGAGFLTTTAAPQKPPLDSARAGGAPVAGGLGAGFVTTTPPPQKPPLDSARAAGAAVAGGLGADFVTTTPVPQKPPPDSTRAAGAAVAGGLGEAFVTTTPPPQKAPPDSARSDRAPTLTLEKAEAFVSTTPAPLNQRAPGAQPSAPSVSAPTAAQGLVLQATIADEKGQPLGNFACTSVTRAGLIVCTAGALPPLLSRVKLTFTELSGLTCDAQVVHHVTAEQAQQWKMSAGYGVQFGALSPEQRQVLEGAHQGLRQPETPSGIAKRPPDPAAEEVLKRFTAERATDGYAMLAISKGAPFDAIRDRVREAKRALEGIAARPLSLPQQKTLEEARARLDEVGKVLGAALTRVEYDAERGNFEGVARCISAGLSVSELEASRLRFLKTHPGIAGKSHGSILAGQTLEARTQMAQALEAYADALRVDPLNLTAQQRYWAVKRQLDKA